MSENICRATSSANHVISLKKIGENKSLCDGSERKKNEEEEMKRNEAVKT